MCPFVIMNSCFNIHLETGKIFVLTRLRCHVSTEPLATVAYDLIDYVQTECFLFLGAFDV